MGNFGGAEICHLVGRYIQSKVEKIFPKPKFGLYRNNWLTLLRNLNKQQTDKGRKTIIRGFKDLALRLKLLSKK